MKLSKICVVDDAPAVQKIAYRILVQQLGKEVIPASNGFEALEVINTHRPDACFIDVEMPELNGLQLVSILRANPKYEKLPIAVLSSNASIFDIQKGLLSGANLYLTKPFSRESIDKALSELESVYE